jgi:hypothetical protein
MAATIKFGSYKFDEQGTPEVGRHIDFEQQGDGLPRVARITWTIKQSFSEQSFADNEARIAALQQELEKGEGVLEIIDETGVEIVKQVVKVRSHNIPEEWRQYLAQVTVSFEGRELIPAGGVDATLRVSGGTNLTLANVQEWRQTSDTQRYNDLRANRRETKVAIVASGFVLADKNLKADKRRAELQAIAESYRSSDSKEATLKYGDDEMVVRVDRLEAAIGDGSERLNWSLSCSYVIFPSGDGYSEADYTFATHSDYVAGERVTSIRGNVRAATEDLGKKKADDIRAKFATAKRTLLRDEVSEPFLSGADGETWVDLSFSFEYHEPIPQITSYELRITTRDDTRTADRTIVYQGKVTAKTTGDSLDEARKLGFGKEKFLISGEETISTKKFGTEDEQLIEVTFSYEYLSKTAYKFAEVTRDLSLQPYGESRETISGYAAAATLAEAQALGKSFKLNARILRDTRESNSTRQLSGPDINGETQLERFEFTYVYYVERTSVSLAYSREKRTDYAASEVSTTFSGIARGPTEAACLEAIDNLAIQGATLAEKIRSPAYEDNELIQVPFSSRYVGLVDSDEGPDIISAEFSIRTTFSVYKSAVTTIPYGEPFIERGVGWTKGRKVVAGNIVARKQDTCINWATDRKNLLTDGEAEPPEEELTSLMAPFDGGQVKQYRMSFTYPAEYGKLVRP